MRVRSVSSDLVPCAFQRVDVGQQFFWGGISFVKLDVRYAKVQRTGQPCPFLSVDNVMVAR